MSEMFGRSSSEVCLLINGGGVDSIDDESYEKFKAHLENESKIITLIGFNYFVLGIKGGHLVGEHTNVFQCNQDVTWSESCLREDKKKKKLSFFKRLLDKLNSWRIAYMRC